MFAQGLSKYLKGGRKLVEHRTELSQKDAGSDDKCKAYNGMANQLEIWRAYSFYAKRGLLRTEFKKNRLIFVHWLDGEGNDKRHIILDRVNGIAVRRPKCTSQYFISKLGLDKPEATY